MSGLRGIDVNMIIALDAILSELNLTRAGERIGMTQSAMSGVLSRLRRHYGDELLIRKGQIYELTETAARLRPIVREAVVEIARTLETAQAFDPATSRRIFSISASDYALAVLTGPLLAIIDTDAPGVDLDFDPLPSDPATLATHLVRRDLVITGMGLGMPGNHQEIFADRFVCIADRGNPRLGPGNTLRTDDLAELGHVVGSFGHTVPTPADMMLAEAGITPRITTTVRGLLTVPFIVAGTNQIALVPERQALSCADQLGLVTVSTPLTPVSLVEAAHWHPANSTDPGLQWLLSILKRLALEPAALP